jgi:hypothetical protein
LHLADKLIWIKIIERDISHWGSRLPVSYLGCKWTPLLGLGSWDHYTVERWPCPDLPGILLTLIYLGTART